MKTERAKTKVSTNLDKLREIKKLALISMFADDELMQLVVLKGGNALDLVYNVGGRASLDLDFSLSKSFASEDLVEMEKRIKNSLESTFREAGYHAFDIKMYAKPPKLTDDMKDFWGGHGVEFKVADRAVAAASKDIDNLRKQAIPLNERQERIFYIEISNYEYCETKAATEMDGYRIYVYTPEMIAIEKLRAICQQMPEYREIVKSPGSSARARDFYDIWLVCNRFSISFETESSIELIRNIFHSKRVDLSLVRKISDYREFHRGNFDAVRTTVPVGTKLEDFDYYFDYVLRICERLESLGVV